MKAFARIWNEIWWVLCVDLAYVDKLAEDNTGVKYLLIRQDLFDWTMYAKGNEQRVSEKSFMHFWLWLQKTRPKINWIDKGAVFAGEFKQL